MNTRNLGFYPVKKIKARIWNVKIKIRENWEDGGNDAENFKILAKNIKSTKGIEKLQLDCSE